MTTVESNLRPLEGFQLGRFPLTYQISPAPADLIDVSGVTVIVSEDGALLTPVQIEDGLGERLHLPTAQLSPEVTAVIWAVRRGMLPDDILPWRDYKKSPSDIVICRAEGLARGTELSMIKSSDDSPVIIDPATKQPVLTSIQYYEARALYPR